METLTWPAAVVVVAFLLTLAACFLGLVQALPWQRPDDD